ncbi:MAG: 4Fe-4S dicluster domain-containing protein [Desulfurococcales archaeon]|jgi:pyruvate ferredoxin oxidoreductase delta subunit|nr:4Fe-4S dicluster domain-containing protein [Desulfurococcales archaeon]
MSRKIIVKKIDIDIDPTKYLVARPKKGAAGRTGLWRTFRPVVKLDKCIDCGICWLYCPEDVIFWEKGLKIKIDYEYCKGCGICSSVCPVKAIEMVREEE